MLGWSYPEAQLATWMSYDTELHKFLLKKLITNAYHSFVISVLYVRRSPSDYERKWKDITA